MRTPRGAQTDTKGTQAISELLQSQSSSAKEFTQCFIRRLIGLCKVIQGYQTILQKVSEYGQEIPQTNH